MQDSGLATKNYVSVQVINHTTAPHLQRPAPPKAAFPPPKRSRSAAVARQSRHRYTVPVTVEMVYSVVGRQANNTNMIDEKALRSSEWNGMQGTRSHATPEPEVQPAHVFGHRRSAGFRPRHGSARRCVWCFRPAAGYVFVQRCRSVLDDAAPGLNLASVGVVAARHATGEDGDVAVPVFSGLHLEGRSGPVRAWTCRVAQSRAGFGPVGGACAGEEAR